MPTEVSQLRPEGVDAAVAFAKDAGFDVEPTDVDPMVSLIAKEEDTIQGAVLGVHVAGGACVLHVCLSKVDDPGELTDDLLNKALMKVHGAGVRRCQIEHHGEGETPAGWPGAKWDVQDAPEPDADAA